MNKRIGILKALSQNMKSQIVLVVVCVFLISAVMNLFLILLTDYRGNFVRQHDKLHAEHVSFIGCHDDIDLLEEETGRILSQQSKIAEAEMNRIYYAWSNYQYNGETLATHFCYLPEGEGAKKQVGKTEILSREEGKDGVLLPYIFEVGGNYRIGDMFTISDGERHLVLPVVGFFSNAMSATENCGYITILFSKNEATQVIDYFGTESLLCSIRLNYPTENRKMEMKISDQITNGVPGTTVPVTNKYDAVFSGRYVMETISTAIIFGLSVLLIFLTVFLIFSDIALYISDHKPMFGILEAVGYTSHDMILSVVPAVVLLVLIVSLCGIGTSYLLFPFINRILESQTGLPYSEHFLVLPTVLTVGILILAVCLSVFLSMRKLHKITPLDTIHSPRGMPRLVHNKVTIRKLCLPLHLSIPMQSMCANILQNVLVFVTAFLAAFLATFGSSLMQNILVNDAAIAEFVLGEFADSSVTVSNDDCSELCRILDESNEVKNYAGYQVIPAGSRDGEYLSAVVIEDAERLTNASYCYIGHMPSDPEEAAIGGKFAKENNIEIGDAIRIRIAGKQVDLKVCGFLQSAMYLGYDIAITKEGCEKIAPLQTYQYYIYLDKDADVKEFNRQIAGKIPVLFSSDMRSALQGQKETYFSGIKWICRMMIAISLIMVLLVLYILIQNLLERKKYDFGVMKALGYSDKSLMLHTVLTYLPWIVTAVAAGSILSGFAFNTIMSFLLSSIGLQKCNFEIPRVLIAIGAAALVVISCIFMLLSARKIRKIQVRELVLN